ncbi:MAG: Rrf2 family transcriptional regulator [Armatimonadetes bacterium]|nr:Rrf2 family transcriptional regulator [Armatimonadota bacterium]
MNLTSKGQYASRAILDLSVHYADGPVTIEEIAERQGVPRKYLGQVLLMLKRAGLVHSVRGRRGGYRLSRPPDQVTLGEVIRATDGPLAPISCVSETTYRPCTCPSQETCGLRTVWREVSEAIADVLDRTSMETIRERTEQLQRARPDALMYHI